MFSARHINAGLLGFSFGIWLTAALMVGGFFLVAGNVQAQVTGTCMLQEECIDKAVAIDNCDAERCFDPGNECPAGQGWCYARWPSQELTIAIGGTKVVNDLGDYIIKVYQFAFGAVGFLVAFMMIVGGFSILTAGGNNSKVTKGKSQIKNAVIGTIIASFAYLILMTINPSLVKLELPKVPVLKRQVLSRCNLLSQCHPCGESFFMLVPKNGTQAQQDVEIQMTRDNCEKLTVEKESDFTAEMAKNYVLGAECHGMSCQEAFGNECGDSAHRCLAKKEGMTVPAECSLRGNVLENTMATRKYVCMSCTPDGEDCNGSGTNDSCCSGFCGDGVCTNGQAGAPCSDDTQCQSKICLGGEYCSTGGVGSLCKDSSDCMPGAGMYCANNKCVTGAEYNRCNRDGDCTGGMSCRTFAGTALATGTGNVMTTTSTEIKVCTGGGTVLSKCSEKCPAGTTCGANNLCTSGEVGTPCTEDGQCKSGKCSGLNGVCTEGLHGSSCNTNGDCQSKFCTCISTGWFGGNCTCTSGQAGAPCEDDEDCAIVPGTSTQLTCQGSRCLLP